MCALIRMAHCCSWHRMRAQTNSPNKLAAYVRRWDTFRRVGDELAFAKFSSIHTTASLSVCELE